MKKPVALILLLMLFSGVYAQNETVQDSIALPAGRYMRHGDFLLDMDLIMPFRLPKPDFSQFLLPDAMPNINQAALRLDPKWTLGKGNISNPSPLYNLYFSAPYNDLMSSSFKLNDNIRLNTYGQYTIDGKRMQNTNPHPWNRNDFMGSFELKFKNNFSIRVDAHRGHNPYFPY